MHRAGRALLLLASTLWILHPHALRGQASAPAADAPAAATPEVQAVIDNVLQIIETETEVATASRMNADYVPGILTVLRGSELEERGMHTVYEALSLVPGLNLSMTTSGEKRVIVRGVGSTFAPSTLKFILNGVSLNSTLDGRAAAVLDIPVEQVDRIEIIRGPGAMLYGEFANAGVVHVLTRRSDTRVFARSGSFATWAGGGMFALERATSGLDLSLNVAGWNTEGADVTAAADKLTDTRLGEFSRAPGPTNEAHQNVTGVLALGYGGFSLAAQFVESRFGDYFGLAGVLPPPGDRKVQVNSNVALEAGRDFTLGPAVSGNLQLGWRRTTRSRTAELLPPGAQLGRSLVLTDGLLEDVHYGEDQLYTAADLTARVHRAHTLLLGAGYSRTAAFDASMARNDQVQPWIDDGTARYLADVFVQDEFEISERLTLTGGLRYDNYSALGDHVTPRLSGVYRVRDRHILKLQYAEAFRPPTFVELAGLGNAAPSPGLEPETIRTFEAGYIFKTPQVDARLTLFASDLDKLIVQESHPSDDTLLLVNSGGATASGGEAELQYRPWRSLTVTGNVSYVKTEDNATGEQIEGSANWLGNLDLVYQPLRALSLTVLGRFVGPRHRGEGDARDELAGFTTVDVVCNVYELPWPGFTVRGGVKNVFDAAVAYPSFTADTREDYPRPGRQWWAQLSYHF